MNQYTHFARLYDTFMVDIPYGKWCDMICGFLGARGMKDCTLLELGCGTGTFSFMMAERGYKVTGIDNSMEMVYEASKRKKARKTYDSAEFLCMDMRAFDTENKFPVVLSVCDSMNYLENTFDLESAFECVRKNMTEDGIFIFDMKTEAFYESLGDNVYTDSADEGVYIWENDYDKEERNNFYYLTFFIRKRKELYTKVTENHLQHAFTEEEVRNAAHKTGLKVMEVLGMDMTTPADFGKERVYYILGGTK